MISCNKAKLSRKIILALGAMAVSTMTLAGAAHAKPKVHFDLHFGTGGFSGVTIGSGGFGPGLNYCDKYWWKYQKTGKFKYKDKYMKCMGYW